MSDDIRPTWSNGLPLCDESCPQHDGKRCRATGFRPARFCEPALHELSDELVALRSNRARLEAAEQRAREAEAERDEARREFAEWKADVPRAWAEFRAEVTASNKARRLRLDADRDAAIARATAAEGRESALRTALGEACRIAERALPSCVLWSTNRIDAAVEKLGELRALAARAPTDATATTDQREGGGE